MGIESVLAIFIFCCNGLILGAGFWAFQFLKSATDRAEKLNDKWESLFSKINEIHNTTVIQQKKIGEWMSIVEMNKAMGKK